MIPQVVCKILVPCEHPRHAGVQLRVDRYILKEPDARALIAAGLAEPDMSMGVTHGPASLLDELIALVPPPPPPPPEQDMPLGGASEAPASDAAQDVPGGIEAGNAPADLEV